MTTTAEASDTGPGFFDQLLEKGKSALASIAPSDVFDGAKSLIADAVAERIRTEANAKARALIAQAHRKNIRTIAWQNGALMLSILPVYFLHAAWPFYVAYACVVASTLHSLYEVRGLLARLLRTRSVTKTLAAEVQEAICLELERREVYERKAVEWFGPDLATLSDKVARELKPEVMVAVANMAFTLLLAFVAFRVFAIPMLEHQALGF